MPNDPEHQASKPRTKLGQEEAERRPEAEARAAEVATAIERLRALRQTFGKAPLDEILASRHEGHKY